MPSLLYFDAARMGRMAPAAQLALEDFVRFSGEQGCTLYFERFLKDGFVAWPQELRMRYPGLSNWGGVAELKDTIRRELDATADTSILVTSRSTNLAELAARFLFRTGRRVLVTDLTWPSYRRILEREGKRAGGRIEVVAIRGSILEQNPSPDSIAQRLTEQFIARRCSGLFLPEISHHGIRLPVRAITQSLRRELGSLPRIVIDGSQAFGQVPIRLNTTPSDFYIAGCHKWLGATLPLGIGVLANPATADEIRGLVRKLANRGEFDDPLHAFLDGMESNRFKRFTETVNVSPLFSCRGALEDLRQGESVAERFERRQANAALVRRIAPMTGWTPLGPPLPDFRSGTVLLQVNSGAARTRSPMSIRDDFHNRQVALTAYAHGIVRLSMPAVLLEQLKWGYLIQALALVQVGSKQVPALARA